MSAGETVGTLEARFVARWTLNREKTPKFDPRGYNPLPVYESIAIERQGSDYKLPFKGSAKGHAQDRSLAAEDRRLVSKLNGSDLDPDPRKDDLGMIVRFTQKAPDRFEEGTSVYQIDYSVSKDGRTMTVRQDIYMDNATTRNLVYDRAE